MSIWLNLPENTDFTIDNIPFGIAEIDGKTRVVSAIGDYVIHLRKAHHYGVFGDLIHDASIFERKHLNDFIRLGKSTTSALRQKLIDGLTNNASALSEHREKILIPITDVQMCLPLKIGNYTDFYSSLEHATNVGKMFRPDNPLLPNWKHMPIGYHGRASSIVVSGTPIKRPNGQTMPPDAEKPVYGPSKRLDIELEMAFVVGKDSSLGDQVKIKNAEDYIFGMVLFNDWSARDIQKWEYVPLGPFLGKNFGSTISPWVITMDALEPFRTSGPEQIPEPLPYLRNSGNHSFNIKLEVELTTANGERGTICTSNFKYLYWNMAQQLAHHTVNGCNICVGDLMASGTISGKTKNSFGSMLELSWGGKEEITINGGVTRKFLEDGDSINLRGTCTKGSKRIGFGPCEGTILPAVK